MLTSPLSPKDKPVVAFDMNPGRVRAGRELGLNVMYGEGWRESVLEAAQIIPQAIIITYSSVDSVMHAVACTQQCFPDKKIYVVAQDIFHAAELKCIGADVVQPATTSTGVRLGRKVMRDLGMTEYNVQYLSRTIDKAFKKRVVDMADTLDQQPLQNTRDMVVLVGNGDINRKPTGFTPQTTPLNPALREDDIMRSYSESLEGTIDDYDDDIMDDNKNEIKNDQQIQNIQQHSSSEHAFEHNDSSHTKDDIIRSRSEKFEGQIDDLDDDKMDNQIHQQPY
eukprot:TRINITY_DN18015_c0_g2_i1.p2 TRINITY_DN18015_c0_g2~~TRINITY_DN18015_c0_g2_i1.p2  ORF type:complete len:280 (+),score=39.07 TRINITY_DN18015_c0_g2_i1:901-1740(+)